MRFGKHDVVTVKVSSSKRFEGVERLVLTETLGVSQNLSNSAPNQGVFTGVMETKSDFALSASGDGVLHVQEHDVLTVEYQEPLDANGRSGVVHTSQVTVGPQGQAAQLSLIPHLLLEDNELCVSVVDDVAVKPKVFLAWRSSDLPSGEVSQTPAVGELEDTSPQEQDADEAMTITVKTFTAKTITLEVTATQTVLQLKEQIQESEGVPPEQQRIIFSGQQLDEVRTLGYYMIRDGSILHLLLQLLAVSGERESEATIVLELEMEMTMISLNSNGTLRYYSRCVPTSIGASGGDESAEDVSLDDGDNFKMWEVPRGTLITATYVDPSPYGLTTDIASVSRSAVLQVRPKVIGLNRNLDITVIDADLNQNASIVESASVSVQSTKEEERVERVTLTEDGFDSQIFTGILRTISNEDPSPETCTGIAASGCQEALSSGPALHVRQGDQIYVTYSDVSSSSIKSWAAHDMTEQVRVGVAGISSINKCGKFEGVDGDLTCKSVLVGGDVLSLTVVDADIGYEERGAVTWQHWVKEDIANEEFKAIIDVDVTTSKDAEVERVRLYAAKESPVGTFTGQLDTCMGSEYCQPREGVFSTADCLDCSNPNMQGKSNNGVMTVRPGDHLTVSYQDQMPTATRLSTIKVARTGVLRLSPAKTVGIGDEVSITVIDDDVNTDAQLAQTSSVRVASPVLGEPNQQIDLVETGADSSHFTGVFTICLGCSSVDGRVRVEPGDFISVTYDDLEVPAVESSASIVSAVVTAADIQMDCVPKVVLPGEAVKVIVLNKDLRLRSDSLQVTAVKLPTADSEREVLTLQQISHAAHVSQILDASRIVLSGADLSTVENLYADGSIQFSTGQKVGIMFWEAADRILSLTANINIDAIPPGTTATISKWGQYEGQLETKALESATPPVLGDNTLEVESSQKIVFSVNDQDPYATLTFQVLVAEPSHLHAFFLNADALPALAVQMTDSDANRDDSRVETARALVVSSRNSESEELLLVETRADSSIFRGWLPLVSSSEAGNNNDGEMRGLPGDILNISYTDSMPGAVYNITRIMAFAAVIHLPRPVFAADRPLTVTVVDPDLNQDPNQPDLVRGLALLKVVPSGDSEPLILKETGDSSSVFTAQVEARLLVPACCAPLWHQGLPPLPTASP